MLDTALTYIDIALRWLFDLWRFAAPVAIFVSLILFTGIIYVRIRIAQVEKSVEEVYGPQPEVGDSQPGQTNARWEAIVAHAHSTNENDWRHAIIDADVMLDELLDAQGYKGESMGDKMKQIERSDFNSIDAAWDAHKMRNRIAHEGSVLQLNEREVLRTIGLYEQVFREFELI
jgi:hypothetical protein